MDDIYKNKTKEEIIELVYCLTKQNLSGRETHDETFMKGIEFCYEELCESNTDSEDLSKLTLHDVSNNEVAVRSCDNCKNDGNKGVCIDCDNWCNYEPTDC